MKRILCIIGLGILAVGLATFGIGCNDGDDESSTAPSTYDVVGTWDYTAMVGNNVVEIGTMTFTGTQSSGTATVVALGGQPATGTYSVAGANITLTLPRQNATGQFDDETHMSGTWEEDDGDSGTWTATKQ